MKSAFKYLGTTIHATQGILLSKALEHASQNKDQDQNKDQGQGQDQGQDKNQEKAQDKTIFPIAVAMAVFHCIVDGYQADKWQVEVIVKEPREFFTLTLPDGRRYRGHELILKPFLGTSIAGA